MGPPATLMDDFSWHRRSIAAQLQRWACLVLLLGLAPRTCSLTPSPEGPFVLPALAMRARRAGMCSLCSASVEEGAEVVPVNVDGHDGGTHTCWVHPHCVPPQQERAVCKHWSRSGACLYQASCAFAHPDHPHLKALDPEDPHLASDVNAGIHEQGSCECGDCVCAGLFCIVIFS